VRVGSELLLLVVVVVGESGREIYAGAGSLCCKLEILSFFFFFSGVIFKILSFTEH